MDKLFLNILNMSLTGSYVILAICLVRPLLKKAPKFITYLLWSVAGFRLVLPFSIESVISLIPFKPQVIPMDIAMQPVPRINSGIPFVNNAVSGLLPPANPNAGINPLQIWIMIGTKVWLVGTAAMIIYGTVSYVVLNHKMKKALNIKSNIYESQNIRYPFVLGIIKPRIYLPVGLSEKEKSYILLHEKTHIRRHDHIVKIAAYFILCLHWFNPLVWAAFLLMGADMEMSCDEHVLKELGNEAKKEYSMSLLSLATEHRIISGSPLAFGEGGMKERIKNVLKFKKPSRVIIIASLILVAVLGTGLAVNRVINTPSTDNTSRTDNIQPINKTPLINNTSNVDSAFSNGNTSLIEMKIIYVDNPAYFSKDMKLIWNDTVYHEITPDNAGQGKQLWDDVKRHVLPKVKTGKGKQIGYANTEYSTWRIYELEDYNHDYLLAVESDDVWRIMSIHSPQMPVKQYILENATEKDKLERLLSISLYENGTAVLATPPISSYLLPPCTYEFSDGELLIYSDFYGKKNREVIARFKVEDQNTLIFESASVPLFAKGGARYILVEHEITPPSLTLYPGVPADPREAKPIGKNEDGLYQLDYVITAEVYCPWTSDITLYFAHEGSEDISVTVPYPIENDIDVHLIRIDIGDIFPKDFRGRVWAVARNFDGTELTSKVLNVIYPIPGYTTSSEARKWFDYYFDEHMPWDKSLELELPEYPGTIFKWTPYEVRALNSTGEKTLFTGMPVWNIYLSDLTGDGLPELCATVSFGSGIIDERIIVCDYSSGKTYELSDRMYYDYALYLDNGRLMVRKTKYPDPQGKVIAAGELAIVDGKLTAIDIERTRQ